jgi:hypothetical protein
MDAQLSFRDIDWLSDKKQMFNWSKSMEILPGKEMQSLVQCFGKTFQIGSS